MRVQWLIPENRGGIFTYGKNLWPAVADALRSEGHDPQDPLFLPIRNRHDVGILVDEIKKARPEILHIQHEYGLFGGKIPILNRFPAVTKQLRTAYPVAKFVATAHTIIPNNFQFPVLGRGWQAPFRLIANHFLLRLLHRQWTENHWKLVNRVVVHSDIQKRELGFFGIPDATVIPHFIYANRGGAERSHPALSLVPAEAKLLMVFGYISPEKGQDLAIEAMKFLPENYHLLIAGGLRREKDRGYFRKCKELIDSLGMRKRVQILGFVAEEELGSLYERADLVIAPFRDTTGSGSLAQAISRGSAILASNHPLNLEVEAREPGCLRFFDAESSESLAKAILHFYQHPQLGNEMKGKVLNYAHRLGVRAIAHAHVELYREILK